MAVGQTTAAAPTKPKDEPRQRTIKSSAASSPLAIDPAKPNQDQFNKNINNNNEYQRDNAANSEQLNRLVELTADNSNRKVSNEPTSSKQLINHNKPSHIVSSSAGTSPASSSSGASSTSSKVDDIDIELEPTHSQLGQDRRNLQSNLMSGQQGRQQTALSRQAATMSPSDLSAATNFSSSRQSSQTRLLATPARGRPQSSSESPNKPPRQAPVQSSLDDLDSANIAQRHYPRIIDPIAHKSTLNNNTNNFNHNLKAANNNLNAPDNDDGEEEELQFNEDIGDGQQLEHRAHRVTDSESTSNEIIMMDDEDDGQADEQIEHNDIDEEDFIGKRSLNHAQNQYNTTYNHQQRATVLPGRAARLQSQQLPFATANQKLNQQNYNNDSNNQTRSIASNKQRSKSPNARPLQSGYKASSNHRISSAASHQLVAKQSASGGAGALQGGANGAKNASHHHQHGNQRHQHQHQDQHQHHQHWQYDQGFNNQHSGKQHKQLIKKSDSSNKLAMIEGPYRYPADLEAGLPQFMPYHPKHARTRSCILILKFFVLLLLFFLLLLLLTGMIMAGKYLPKVIEEVMSAPRTFNVTISG